jgi:xanthine dehydrogenase accessory factor
VRQRPEYRGEVVKTVAVRGDLTTLMTVAAQTDEAAVLARVVGLKGFGGATRVGQGVVVFKERWEGSFLGSSPHESVLAYGRSMLDDEGSPRIVEIVIGDDEAVAAQLACGGVATVALTSLDDLRGAVGQVLAKRVPYAVLMAVAKSDGSVLYQSVMELADGLDAKFLSAFNSERFVGEIDSEIRRGRPGLFQLDDDDVTVYGEVICPPSTVVVLGAGDLAEAIAGFGAELDIGVDITTTVEEAQELVSGLGPLDALIVLSHDHGLATPVISTLVRRSPQTYVGSLGSRHTQQERRRSLYAEGFSVDELGGLYGPAGLDLGSRTVKETAIAILAEFLAHRSGRSGGHLRDSAGPING